MRYAREYPRAHLLVPRPTRRLRARLHVQVLVAGSLAVMSVMGVPVSDTQWKDLDVDIFCTWDAAPVVRQRLIERCGLICSWVDNSYRQEGPDLSTKLGAPDFVQTCLSHVESYNSRRMEGRYGDEYDDDSKRLEYTSDAYFARACQWGAEAVASHPKRLGTPKGSAGVSFPYDYELRRNSFVQLIVGHPSLKDARALLTKFDLEICKFSFDGTTFRAPNAVKSFAGRTSVTPARHALVTDFIKNVTKLAPDVRYDGRNETKMVTVLGKVTAKSLNGIGATKFKTKDASTMMSKSWFDFQARYVFLTKLVERMRKYAKPGVVILQPPEGALEWEIAEYSVF